MRPIIQCILTGQLKISKPLRTSQCHALVGTPPLRPRACTLAFLLTEQLIFPSQFLPRSSLVTSQTLETRSRQRTHTHNAFQLPQCDPAILVGITFWRSEKDIRYTSHRSWSHPSISARLQLPQLGTYSMRV